MTATIRHPGTTGSAGDPPPFHYVEAPHPYEGTVPCVFLAGGISNCPDWQAEVVRALEGLPLAVLNPRRRLFHMDDHAAARTQIEWEHAHLRRADVVLFWFPAGTSVQPIALYELGAAAADPRRTIAVGADAGYARRLDVELQLRLARPELQVRRDLGSTVEAALELLAGARPYRRNVRRPNRQDGPESTDPPLK